MGSIVVASGGFCVSKRLGIIAKERLNLLLSWYRLDY